MIGARPNGAAIRDKISAADADPLSRRAPDIGFYRWLDFRIAIR